MAYKILAIIITVLAVALAIVVSFWNQAGLGYIVFISRFFDVMLPIFAVGALVKYLFTKPHCSCNDSCCSSSKKPE
jgi:hypothetical protein